MLSTVFLIVGLAILGFACRSFQKTLIRKMGLLAFMGASFVLFQELSGSWVVGCLGIALWFCLPWIELLTRVRQMDLPIEKPLRRRIPPEDTYPFLAASASEIENVGAFEHIDDWGYEWNGAEHFFRLFYDTETRTQAIVCLTADEFMTHAYVKLVSRASNDQAYTTWNYPFAASLKQSPENRLHWDRTSASFYGILDSHLEFLDRMHISSEEIKDQDTNNFMEMLRADQRRLVDHNLSQGVLKPSGEGVCRYTWRGLIFLWTQLVKDMVRLH